MNDRRRAALFHARDYGSFNVPDQVQVDPASTKRASLALDQKNASLARAWMKMAESFAVIEPNNEKLIDLVSDEFSSPSNRSGVDVFRMNKSKKTKKRSFLDSNDCTSPTTFTSEDQNKGPEFNSKRHRVYTKESSLVPNVLCKLDTTLLGFSSFQFPVDVNLESIETPPAELFPDETPLSYDMCPSCDIDNDLLDLLLKPSCSKEILIPNDNDIILGRGKSANIHPGNIKYRNLVEKAKPIYESIGRSNKNKKAFTVDILRSIKAYGGRFLELDDVKTGAYREVCDKKAREKISQRLRESS